MVYQLVYISRNLVGARSEAMAQIAETAISRNAEIGVTGMLYYDDDRFLQVLEGAEQKVVDLFRAIRSDTRHTEVVEIGRYSSRNRSFENFSMGLFDGSADPKVYGQAFGVDRAPLREVTDSGSALAFLSGLRVYLA